MARIRSVHPGLFTDEAFVSISMAARVFLIGVWTEADDHGVFEWKPVSLKMRLLPADNTDAAALLDELATADLVRKVEHEGKQYGIVRNFCAWQRPKRPTYRHPFPPAWVEYVAFKGRASTTSTPPVPHRSRTASPKAPQRKEGGGKVEREDEGGNKGVVVAGGRAGGTALAAEAALIAGNLWKQFCDAYRGPVNRVAEQRFRNILATGENADPIIAAAPRANPQMPAEQWLDERAWLLQLSLLPTEKPKRISDEAHALAREIARLAGQDWDFLEPGWCGAVHRCQMWLDEGWPCELIEAGVRSTVTARASEKISNVSYFDKPLARFIAQQRRPVPQVIEQAAEVIHVQTRQHHPDSWQAGQVRGRGSHRKLKQAIALAESGESG